MNRVACCLALSVLLSLAARLTRADQSYMDCLGALRDEGIITKLFKAYETHQQQGLQRCSQCQSSCENDSKTVTLRYCGKDMLFTVTPSSLSESFHKELKKISASRFPVGREKLYIVRKDEEYEIFNHGTVTNTVAIYCEYESNLEASSPEPQVVPGSPFGKVQYGLGDSWDLRHTH